jgi:hypothetical protein
MLTRIVTAAVTLLLSPAACGNTPGDAATPGASPADVTASDGGTGADVVGTIVRFAAGTASVDVTLGEDSPATRDFLSMLPITVTVEQFNGREKIADLPRELHHEGSPGSDPEDGDLIYFIPWGNIGFYYDAAGIGYSDQTLHLGTFDATAEQLEPLEGQDVTVEVVN